MPSRVSESADRPSYPLTTTTSTPSSSSTPTMRSLYLGLLLTPSLVSAYSFVFNSAPRQCQNMSVSITGSGSPPYSLLIIPVGPTPLANSVEVRKITQLNFTGTESSLSTQLKFPENSQFVAVVSSSFGFSLFEIGLGSRALQILLQHSTIVVKLLRTVSYSTTDVAVLESLLKELVLPLIRT